VFASALRENLGKFPTVLLFSCQQLLVDPNCPRCDQAA